jgi:hypothetical protein
MKSRKLTLLFALSLLSTIVMAQDYAFKVMANKGTNEIKSGDAWQPIKTGASLKSGDELKLADNSYIGLIHASGKPLELKQAGNYKVAELAAKITGGSSAINKYTDFILSSNSDEKKNKLSATGAVHRDTEIATIKVVLPVSQYAGVYNNQVVVNWDAGKVEGPFIVTLKNMFDDQLAVIETSTSSIRVDFSQPKFAEENAILIDVRSKDDSQQHSKQYTVKRLSASEHEKVKKLFNDIMGEVSEQTALNNFILAGFYESQGLLIDAIVAYEDAVKIEPSYQEDYENFLIRNGLKQ